MLNQSQIDELRTLLEIREENDESFTLKEANQIFSALVDLRNEIRQVIPLLTDAARTSLAVRTARNHLKSLLR